MARDEPTHDDVLQQNDLKGGEDGAAVQHCGKTWVVFTGHEKKKRKKKATAFFFNEIFDIQTHSLVSLVA